LNEFFVLHLDGLESPVEFFALVDLPDEEVAVTPIHLCVRNVNHVLVDIEVDLKRKKSTTN
jgi:hypothetical protein